MARGGKRLGAGRKPGPKKKRLIAYVLPVTLQEVTRRASDKPSLGAVLDQTFKPTEKHRKNS